MQKIWLPNQPSERNGGSAKRRGSYSALMTSWSEQLRKKRRDESARGQQNVSSRSSTSFADPTFWPRSWTIPGRMLGTASTASKRSTTSPPTDQKPQQSKSASSSESTSGRIRELKVRNQIRPML